MAGWAPFLAVVALLTVAVLLLARQSQRLVDEYGPNGESDGTGDDGARRVDAVSDPTTAQSPEADPPGETSSGTHGADDHSGAGSEPWEESPAEAGPELQLTTGMLLANVAVTQGLVAVIVVVAGWYFAVPADAFGVTGAASNVGPPAVGLGVAFGLALWVGNELATAVADAAGAAYDEAVREMLAPDSVGGRFVLFGAVLPIIAVSEELLFRAALVGVPAAGYGVSPWLLAVVSSVAFALGHGAQGRVGIVVTGALGFVLAAGYVASGSLLLVVVAHYVINATEFLVHEGLGFEDALFGPGNSL